ncbi:MAG: ABC transporter ATP-binding protein [Firmicutes bacterium]|nr:ABC transporter ATP-binding protein [Bacillota bacterium]
MRRYVRHLPDKPEEKIRLKDIDKKTRRILVEQIKLEKFTLLGAFAFMLVVTGTSLLSPYISKLILDSIQDGSGTWLLSGTLTLILLAILSWAGTYFRSYLTSLAANRSVSRIRQDLYSHVVNQSVSFFEREKTGDIITRLTSDVGALADTVSSGLITLVGDLVTLFGVVIIMFRLSPKLAIWIFVTVPIMIWLLRIFGYRIKKTYRVAREKSAELTSGVEEDLSGIKVVQSLNRQELNTEIFSERSSEAVNANIKATKSTATLAPLMALNQSGGMILVLLIGGREVITGTATIGTLLAFISYTNHLYGPLNELTSFYTVLQGSLASLERISDYLSRKTSVPEPKDPVSLKECTGRIELKDVRFSYGEVPLFENLNLAIEPGETLAVVGPTGSGKSTLINLISRLYDPQEGTVSLDGIDLRDLDPNDLRRFVGVVPQTVTLFAGTIRDNIGYAKKDATDDEIISAAKQAAIHDYIVSLPNGYHTEIGETGKGLSGGQRQLISYARAILLNPKVLILDEATSSVDAGTELAIRNAMETVLENRTSIIIAHRFATLKYATKIALINEGKLEAIGTKDELLQSNTLFKDLVEKQILA